MNESLRNESAALAPFASSLEHLVSELARIDVLLAHCLAHARSKQPRDRFAGLYISDADVDALAAGLRGAARPFAGAPEQERQLAAMANANAARVAVTTAPLRLERLRSAFALTPFDVGALLLALAPELDLRYERIFGYLQDDVTRSLPSVGFLLDLCCDSMAAAIAGRARLEPGSPLRDRELVLLLDNPHRVATPLLGCFLRVAPRIVSYLLGSDEPDARLAGLAHQIVPARDAVGDDARLERIESMLRAERRLLIHLQGGLRAGKRQWAEQVCTRMGSALFVVDGEAVAELAPAQAATLFPLVVREAALQGACVLVEGFDALLDPGARAAYRSLVATLRTHDGMLLLAGAQPWEPPDQLAETRFVTVPLTPPTHDAQVRLWSRALGAGHAWASDATLSMLASTFPLAAADIRATAADARSRARLRDGGNDALALADIHAACRARTRPQLGLLARRIEPNVQGRDLVLPDGARQQLDEMCQRARLRGRVVEDWGFGMHLRRGTGLHALFFGPSGTGKTMAAEWLASELGVDLLAIDLAQVIDKYVGETEKNLGRIFDAAADAGAILFFDEADALFGARSEVKSAHDRYANGEVAYLLQRMEAYEGISILATNLRRNLDEAFTRRMAFVVTFPMPDEAARRQIWQRVWPRQTPLAADLDFAAMAQRFELSGGSIKNAALAAAFLAAHRGEAVTMGDLLRATRRELLKMGKTMAAADADEYARPGR